MTSAPRLPAGRPPPTSLYLHLPFCRHRCHYCDFSVARAARAPVGEWLACVERELARRFRQAGWPSPLPLRTLYVGGGTPSLLGPDGMARLAELLRARFRWEMDGEAALEWTAEANPASLDRGLARAWRKAGVTRLSVGVQSFDDGPLAWLGRLHDGAGAARALADARAEGFDDLNVDLIFGLPAEVERSWEAEVRRAVELDVAHLTAYGLTAEPATPLGREVRSGRVRMPGEGRYSGEYRTLARTLREAGYVHYEVSNFARPGHECRHNWQYWSGASYLGLGPSAHSFLPPFRAWNVFRWDAYRETVRAGRDPLEAVERVEGEAARLERVWLGLRTRAGLPLEDPAWRGPAGAARLKAWRGAGWIGVTDGRVVPTLEGWLRLDALTTDAAGAAAPAGAPDEARGRRAAGPGRTPHLGRPAPSASGHGGEDGGR